MPSVLTGRYNVARGSAMAERFVHYSKLREVARRAKLVTTKPATPNVISYVSRNVRVIENMQVKCNYCDELVSVPYTWVVNLKTKQLIAIIDPDTQTQFAGWDSIVPGYGNLRMKHPHVNGTLICTGNEQSGFKGSNAAIDALMMGLNPNSEYFSGRVWLSTLGHECPDTRFCPKHGYSCAWYEVFEDNGYFKRAAHWSCKRPPYEVTRELACGCAGTGIYYPSSHLFRCGSELHSYAYEIRWFVRLTDITEMLTLCNGFDNMIRYLSQASTRTGINYPTITNMEEFRHFLQEGGITL